MNQTDQSEYLEQYEKAPNKLLFSVSIVLFVAQFMIVFQPFGVTNYDPGFRAEYKNLTGQTISSYRSSNLIVG